MLHPLIALILSITYAADPPARWREFATSESQQALADGKSAGMVLGVRHLDGTCEYLNLGIDAPGDAGAPEEWIFEIGSITKTMTTLLLADRVEKGLMKLDDPVQKYLPDDWVVPKSLGKPITLYDLATHSSGLPRDAGAIMSRFLFDDFWATHPFERLTPPLVAESLSRAKIIESEVGKVCYSNLGMGLLGDAIALQAGKSYEELVREVIAEPLGMEHTWQVVPDQLVRFVIAGRDEEGNDFPGWKFGALAGCGAIRSSAQDMLKYLAAQSGAVESPLSTAMTKTQELTIPMPGDRNHIGLGWITHQDPDQPRFWWHNGGTGGYRSYAAFQREPPVAVVALSRTNPAKDAGFIDKFGVEILKRLTSSER